MKTRFQITLWDKIQDAINDLEYDEPISYDTEIQIVERLIELAYHYRFECNRLLDEKFD